MDSLTGLTIRSYAFHELLGAGGYGQVYKAYQSDVARAVAIKVILPQHANQPEFSERFEREAHLIARLEHLHIVPLFDYWHDDNGAFLVMRWLKGGSLRQWLKAHGALSLSQTRRILEQIGEALTVAHQAGVVHRDLKPDNILLDDRGNAYLSDFGIAKDTTQKDGINTSGIVGTPAYFAPEQLRGEPVTPQTDLYNFGIILYEMLAGEHPFAAASGLSVIDKHLNQPLPLLRPRRPDLPLEVDRIIQRATEKQAAQRYPTIEALVADFQAALNVALTPDTLSPASTPIMAPTWADTHADRTVRLTAETPLSNVPQTPSSPADRNRYRMLQNVRSFWITGVLDNSLHGALLLELGMKQSTGRVQHPWDTLLRDGDSATQTLPPGASIISAFDRLNGKLLILGDPGGGKTTVLLELARDLLTRAERDSEQPIPVVFNLSSWAEQQRPLIEWLAAELNSKYQVPKAVAADWIKADALLLLLDGLDEVDNRCREACVSAINHYRGEHGFVDVVVCSRTADYEALTAKLVLNGAIVLQPLNDAQIEKYLESLGEGLAPLRRMLPADPTLQDMIRSPLMLSITTLAYQNATPDSLQEAPEKRRSHIFDAYVQRMFARRVGEKRYTPEQTILYLQWIAQRMTEHGQSVFQIEGMQPAWLTPDQFKRYRRSAFVLVTFAWAAVLGLTVPIIAVLFQTESTLTRTELGIIPFTILGTLMSVLLGAYFGVIYTSALWRRPLTSFVTSVAITLCGMFFFVPDPWVGAFDNTKKGIVLLVAFIIFLPLYYATIRFGVSERRKIDNSLQHLVFVEKIEWNWRKIDPRFLLLSPFLALVVQIFLSKGNFVLEPILNCLFFFALFAVIGGISPGNLQTRPRPNEGMWQSFRFANRFSFALLLIFMLFPIPLSMGIPVSLALVITIYIIALFLPFIWLISGTGPLYHFLMRRVLVRDGLIPKNMARFLDYSAALILLRKVGGSYIFIHRTLLEYFAARE